MKNLVSSRRLRLESLEERTLLAVTAGLAETAAPLAAPTGATNWVVNTTDDPASWDTADDILSLREAIGRAQTGDTITFDASLAGGTITLSGSELSVDKGITIDANGIGGMTINANDKSRVFHISGGTADIPVELIGLTVTGGSAPEYYEYAELYRDGGGIWTSGTLTLTDCTVTGNSAWEYADDVGYYGAHGRGGGIYNYGTLTLTGCTVTENFAICYGEQWESEFGDGHLFGGVGDGEGGGIYNDSGTLTLTNCIVAGNAASGGGDRGGVGCGGAVYNSGTLTLTNCAVTGNSSNDEGGAFYNYEALTLTNCTVTGNSAKYGGGIYIYGSSATAYLYNTIVAQNTASSSGSDVCCDSGSLYAYNNISSFTGWAIGSLDNLVYDPSFPLFADAADGDYTLARSSQAVNKGSNSYVEKESDLAGNPRIFDGTVDIGAYEYQEETIFETPSTVVTTSLDIRDQTDNLISLYEAIYYAAVGDTITFDVSLKGETITLGGTELSIDKGITIDASSIGGMTIDAGGKSRVFNVSGVTANAPVELVALTVTGGYAQNGGGIYNTSKLTLTNCAVTGNNSSVDGGAVYNSGGLTLIDCAVTGNSSSDDGGAVYNSGTLTLTNCAVTGNSSSNRGGAFYNYRPSAVLTLTDCTVAGNSTSYGGGAVYNSGTLTLTNCVVTGNSSSNRGGAFFNYRSSNYDSSAVLTLTNCTVAGNSASYSGGAFFNYDFAVLTLTNCTVSGNTANSGGGIYHYRATANLYNTIIVQNTASDSGNDIYRDSGSLYAHNTLSSYTDWTESEYCLAYDSSLPLFTDAGSGDYTLIENSQAIDKGDNSYISGYETDLAGNARIVNGIVDIGAYESQNGEVTNIELPSTVVTTELDVVDPIDNLISLREAITYAASGDTVTFDSSLAGKTITLSGTELSINKGITIDASSIGGMTIDAGGRSRVFDVFGGTANTAVELIALTITGGYASDSDSYGGGIENFHGVLALTNCTVRGNYADIGGGIDNDDGRLTLTNCTVAGNSARRGGGIYNTDGTAKLYNTIVAQNTESGYNSDIYRDSGSLYARFTLSSYTGWTDKDGCPVYDSALPLFAGAANGDYTLAENSQAIDKGSNYYVKTETDLAGNARIIGGAVDIGAYEYDPNASQVKPLTAPSIATGSNRVYVSYGANRHQIQWSAVANASGYELAYSADGNSWTTVSASGTSAVVTGLAYGAAMRYRVRALGTSSYTDSDWSAVKTFSVCPMDINNDEDISGGDRTLLGNSWLSEEGEDEFRYYCDINGDGDIGGADRVYLSNNWLLNVEDDADDLQYPPAKASDAVFAEFASADLAVDLDQF